MPASHRRGIQYRHVARYGEIISGLVKYGFGDLLATVNIQKHLGNAARLLRGRSLPSVVHLSRWERLRMLIEELGPTFVKLGQFMSTRGDLLPPDLIAELEKLQDAVPPFPAADARLIVEKELGRPIAEMFTSFDDNAIASASMAQVHHAVLITGEEVAVKVMRPQLERLVDTDLDILYNLAHLLDRAFQESWGIRLSRICEEFDRALRTELDFTIEAAHIEHFAADFEGDPDIHVPVLHRRFSSRRVLTCEFIRGIKVSNLAEIDKAGLDRKVIAARGATIILKQIFEHGFFHADPHAGNILVMPGNVVCFLDFGMTGVLLNSHREHLSAMVSGVVARDSRRIVRALLKVSKSPLQDPAELEYEVAELIGIYSHLSIKDINVGDLLTRLRQMVVRYNLRVIPGFFLLLKALVTIEGIGFRLDPEFNLVEHLAPFVKKMLSDRYTPEHMLVNAYQSGVDLIGMLRDFPGEARELFDLIKAGRLRIEFEHRGLEPMLAKHDQLVNRLVFAVVLAALIIGSSLIVHAGVPPRLFGMPVIGVAGFVLAGIVGFWLVISMLRHGKL